MWIDKKRILHLTLKKKWFDMIFQEIKEEEYREIKPYWGNILCNRIRFGNKQVTPFNITDGVFDLDGWNKFTGSRPVFREFDEIHFKNGYAKDAPFMRVEFKGIKIGEVNPEWASEGTTGKFFVIKLGEILEFKNVMCRECGERPCYSTFGYCPDCEGYVYAEGITV